MKNKKILFISNIYLPQKTGGTQRICKFFEGLNESPLETFLVTAKDYFNSSLREKNIFRVHDFFYYFKSARNKNERIKPEIKKRNNLISSIKKYIYLFFCSPDEHLTFIFFAFLKAFKVIRKNKIDYVISTYPSVSNLVVGWLISLVFRKKHVVDLRETWLNTPDWSMKYDSNFLIKTRIKIENLLERHIISQSYKVILNNKWMENLYEKKYGNGDKYIIIPNGFDGKIIENINKSKISDEHKNIKIIYTGSYYLKHQPDYIFKGIKRAIEKHPELRDKIKFNIFGNIDEVTRCLIKNYSDFYEIKYFSYLSKEDVFYRIVNSDLGIISFPPIEWSAGKIPGKIYEYKKIGIDMLIIGEKDSALQYLSEEFGEKFIYAKDMEGISDYIIEFSKGKERKKEIGKDTNNSIEEYDYLKIVEKLRSLFI